MVKLKLMSKPDPLSSLLLSNKSSAISRDAFSALKAFALSTGSRFNVESRAQGCISYSKKTLSGCLQLPLKSLCVVGLVWWFRQYSAAVFFSAFVLKITVQQYTDTHGCVGSELQLQSLSEPDRANRIMAYVTDE